MTENKKKNVQFDFGQAHSNKQRALEKLSKDVYKARMSEVERMDKLGHHDLSKPLLRTYDR